MPNLGLQYRLNQTEYQERRQIYDYHTGSRRNGIHIGKHQADEKADHGYGPRRKDHAGKAFKYPHGGEGRKDDQAGDQHGSHHPHAENNSDCRQHGNQHVVKLYIHTGSLCEILIKGNRKQLVVTEHKQTQYNDGQHST